MATRQTVERAVRGYVATGSGLNAGLVIPAKSKGPSPDDPYATVLLIENRQRGVNSTESAEVSGNVRRRTFSTEEVTYEIQWLRDGAQDLANRFRAWTGSPDGREHATEHGITFMQCGPIQDATTEWGDGFEERVRAELTICIESTYEDTVGPVEVIPLNVPENDEIEVTA